MIYILYVFMCGFLFFFSRLFLGFKFGEKQNGETVDHVVLPPWAKGDPRLFVLKHRQVIYRSISDDVILFYFRHLRVSMCPSTCTSGLIWCLDTSRLVKLQ